LFGQIDSDGGGGVGGAGGKTTFGWQTAL